MTLFVGLSVLGCIIVALLVLRGLETIENDMTGQFIIKFYGMKILDIKGKEK